MSEEKDSNPAVPGHETLYRAITCKEWWSPDDPKHVSSAAFSNPSFSTDIKSLTSKQKTLSRFKKGSGLAEFSCAEARNLQFDARREIDPAYPDNLAHANVYCTAGNSQRKRLAKKLTLFCTIVETPSWDN